MRFKLGRLDATRPHGLADFAVYGHGRLPMPPPSVSVPPADYPLDGNATYGDCVMAGVAHLIAAWDAAFGRDDPVPSEQEVVDEYFTLTGGQDSGLNEASVLARWHRLGLFGEKIAGYAPIQPNNLVNLHQAIAFYGGAMLGIACPESAQEQFNAGEPWTYDPNSSLEGGHCIVALGYTHTEVLCATWGGIARVTYPFLAHYLDEAWCVLPHQLVEARGDTLGIDLETLAADLPEV